MEVRTDKERSPCGLGIVELYTDGEAVDCIRYVSGTKVDERVMRCDLDPGYKEGRQYGRGRSGGQVRDEYRQEYDAGRGGWDKRTKRERSYDDDEDQELYGHTDKNPRFRDKDDAQDI